MVRTRFAPSPTGKIHIGNVRTALFAYLFAKHSNGKFVLRIEDTDIERSKEEYTNALMDDLKWLGLNWDEGPIVGGITSSYYQSQRFDVYQKIADDLIKKGLAYKCYCTEEELEKEKELLIQMKKPPHYSGKCRHLSLEQQQKYEAEGRKPTIRFKAYEEDFSFHDIVKGNVTFPKGMVGDFVIMRSNGRPVYNFSVVVDDVDMKITHVLRADEHLSNTVRQLMIYKALEAPLPEFAHFGLVFGPDHKKLSKRHGATSVAEYREQGYLPEALVNALVLLGWSSPDATEIFDMKKLIKLFSLDRISPSPAVFDLKKLDWISKHHMIDLDLETFTQLALPYLKKANLVHEDSMNIPENKAFIEKVISITRGYCSKLSELPDHVSYFLKDDYPITKEALSFLNDPSAKAVLLKLKEGINQTDEITEENFPLLVKEVQKTTDVKGKNLFMPIRSALTGRTHGPELYLLLPIIGKERAIMRLNRALDLIGA